jgi:predicted transcriptional regulator
MAASVKSKTKPAPESSPTTRDLVVQRLTERGALSQDSLEALTGLGRSVGPALRDLEIVGRVKQYITTIGKTKMWRLTDAV